MGDPRNQNCQIFRASESKILKGTNKNDTHHHEDNPTHNTQLIRCKKKLVSDTNTKTYFVTPTKSTAKVDPKKTSTLKESLFAPSFQNKNDRST